MSSSNISSPMHITKSSTPNDLVIISNMPSSYLSSFMHKTKPRYIPFSCMAESSCLPLVPCSHSTSPHVLVRDYKWNSKMIQNTWNFSKTKSQSEKWTKRGSTFNMFPFMLLNKNRWKKFSTLTSIWSCMEIVKCVTKETNNVFFNN